MSPVAILGTRPVIWDYYVAGPYTQNPTLTNNFNAALAEFLTPGYSPVNDGSATPRQIVTFNAGGGGVVTTRAYHRGILALQMSTNAAASIQGFGGINIFPNTDRAGLAAGYKNPSWRRVNWFTVNMAIDDGTLDVDCGLIFASSGGAQSVDIWPTAAAWGQGFGVVGDAAGNWNWENYASGVPGIPAQEVVSLAPAIADAEDFNTFDHVFVSATGTRPARYELHINGALFLQRNWETGITLDPLNAAAHRWSPIWRNANTTTGVIYLSDWVYRAGRFLPDGRELDD